MWYEANGFVDTAQLRTALTERQARHHAARQHSSAPEKPAEYLRSLGDSRPQPSSGGVQRIQHLPQG